MNIFSSEVKVLIYREPTDMRCSFSGLSVLVESVLKEDPLTGQLFVFLNRRRDYVKVLDWEQSGYCLWSKRLEVGTYRVPEARNQSESEKVTLSVTELRMILDGFELSNYQKRKRYKQRQNNLHEM